MAAERDQVERESRDKETKYLNLQRQYDELKEKADQLERIRVQQARELEDLVSKEDDVGKSVCFTF